MLWDVEEQGREIGQQTYPDSSKRRLGSHQHDRNTSRPVPSFTRNAGKRNSRFDQCRETSASSLKFCMFPTTPASGVVIGRMGVRFSSAHQIELQGKLKRDCQWPCGIKVEESSTCDVCWMAVGPSSRKRRFKLNENDRQTTILAEKTT